MTLTESVHVNAAARSRLTALLVGLIFAVIGFLLKSAAENGFVAAWTHDVRIPHVVGDLAASLLVAAAGLISAGMVVHGRLRAVAATQRSAEPSTGDAGAAKTPADLRPAGAPAVMAPRPWLAPEWLAGWPQVFVSMLLGATAMMAVTAAWGAEDQGIMTPMAQQVFGGLLVVLAFPFLLLERVYAGTSPDALPDAPQIERLLRVPLVTFVGLGITGVLASVGFEWPSLVERAIAILIGLVALELVLRGAAMLFVPFAPIEKRRSVADSFLARILRVTLPSVTTVGTAVKRQFGIDLSRSWALAFVRRAALPIGVSMAVLAWCLTGVTALGLNERAVYERFGVPVAILGPGLHLHLPWPLGNIRSVELGVVHEIPIVFTPLGAQQSQAEAAARIPEEAEIEGLAPASADRLWDASHPSEASYLIASESQGKQSFQIVNIDLRVVYRVGLSAEAARDAAYAIADPEALIRAMAGQLLVRYFARNTLLDVLGASRERFSNDFRSELQDGLQKLSTGIEVIAVVVEAIHPPPDAANAYHNVQAAEILAQSQISMRRADAIGKMKLAQQIGTEDRNYAIAKAAELVNKSQAEGVLFQGDRQAYHQDGRAFLFERWLDRLGGSLPKSSFIVIDHRLKGVDAPTIDLRSFEQSGSAYETIPAAPGPSTAVPGATSGPSTAKPGPASPPGAASQGEEDGDD